MNTQKQKNLEKLIFDSLDKEIEGTDIYNYNGSMWVIFTDEKKWVVEFTKERTLWYNYYIFNNIMMLFGMDNKETAEYVKKWFENRFLFKPKVVDTIQNGVKSTPLIKHTDKRLVEDTIQNGVKEVKSVYIRSGSRVGDDIQYGVKKTYKKKITRLNEVEDTIQNGVKHTEWNGSDLPTHKIEDAIQNGVKETKTMAVDRIPLIKKVFQNGVKEVEYYDGDAEVLVNDAIENGVKEVMNGNGQVFLVSEVIKKGVKIVDYHILESMEQKDHSVTTLDFTEKIKDTIENGVKEISSVDCEYPRATENVIKNGEKLLF